MFAIIIIILKKGFNKLQQMIAVIRVRSNYTVTYSSGLGIQTKVLLPCAFFGNLVKQIRLSLVKQIRNFIL